MNTEYENFIINKDEANIDEIQKLLKFSSVFGRECFFSLEEFYRNGDQERLSKDYRQQWEGKRFFESDRFKLDRLKTLIGHVKDIRGVYIRGHVMLEETDLFDLKQFLISFSSIQTLFEETALDLEFEHVETDDLLSVIDPQHPHEPVFSLYPTYSPDLAALTQRLADAKKALTDLRKSYIDGLNHDHATKIPFSYDHPAIIERDNAAASDLHLLDKLDVVEDTPYFIKVMPKRTEGMKNMERAISALENDIETEKYNLLQMLSETIYSYKKRILRTFEIIGCIDSYLTKIEFGITIKGIVPELGSTEFMLAGARNVVLENLLIEAGLEYTPLTISLQEGASVLTGSNMGGKTCVLKTIAQIAYLVHAGLMIPAEKAVIPLFNGIYISKIVNSSIKEGLSNFGYELVSIKKVWDRRNDFFLFLLDEPASGTNPVEGRAIVKSIAATLAQSDSFTVISTHYDGISEGIPCRRYAIRGINRENLPAMLSILGSSPDFALRLIHPLIDHTVVEIGPGEEVPKNAIDLLALFKFEPEFIDYCKRELNRPL